MIREWGLICAAVAGLGLTALQAEATESGFYIGLTGGESKTDFEKQPLDAAVDAAYSSTPHSFESELENSQIAYGLFAGFSFNRYVAIEASYQELAESSYDFSGIRSHVPNGGFTLRFGGGAEWTSKGFTLTAVGTIPLGEKFDVHARAGAFFADTRFEQLIVNPQPGASAETQELLYGIGVAYRFTDSIRLAVEYSLYPDVGSEATGESDVEVAALTLGYHF